MIDFLEEIEKIEEEIISIRRELHQTPEAGGSENNTSKIIKKYLEKFKISYYTSYNTGVVGIIRGIKKTESEESRVIALRADMDGLPITEENEVSYKSKNDGFMHACGHDGHMAILLGAAKVLNQNRNLFNGCIKLIFEPAEETYGGARFMIEENVLKNPKVDAIFGLHVSENLETSKIMLKEKYINASSNPFKITIIGRGSHGAVPDISVDPIVTAAEIVMAVQTISSRKISPKHPVVVTIGAINGGSAPNVIPDRVVMKGIIRTTSKEDRNRAKESLTRITENICMAHGADSNIEISEGYPNLYNSEDMCRKLICSARKIIGKRNVLKQKDISMGVESFAYFTLKVPGCFYYLGTKNEKIKTDIPAHTSKFNIDEAALKYGAAIQCQIAYDFLSQ